MENVIYKISLKSSINGGVVDEKNLNRLLKKIKSRCWNCYE